MPKETGMMFKGELVRAILEGRKTQTRRIVAMPRKRDSFVMLDYGKGWWPYQSDDGESELCNDGNEHPYTAPYGNKGDLIYVRETFSHFERNENFKPGCKCFYRVDGESVELSPWRPSIHMPKWAARIWLEITGVRVEQLQDISEADAEAEGIAFLRDLPDVDETLTAKELFEVLWQSTGGDWISNPWVWVYDFKRIDKKIAASA